jgi:hypothetical protein
MEDFELKELELEQYKKILAEMIDINKKLDAYRKGDLNSLGDMSYADIVKRLQHLRQKQLITKKDVKKRYSESKDR